MAAAFDGAKAEAFGGQMMGVLNGAMISIMCSVGHQTGLFDRMADMEPATSDQIARTAGLNERYVREWLAAMVTGRIVDYDAGTRTYSLPAEHAASLTRAAGPGNMCNMLQFTALIGDVEQEPSRASRTAAAFRIRAIRASSA